MATRAAKNSSSKRTESVDFDVCKTQFTELRTAFTLIDKNQDGRLSVSELQSMLKNFGIDVPDKIVIALVKQASQTGACLLNENEFLNWMSNFFGDVAEDGTEDVITAFKVFDRDNDGYITKDELRGAMELMGEQVTDQELDNMIAHADVNKDGRIDYDEFSRLFL